MINLTVQMNHIRWSKPGHGAIMVGTPIEENAPGGDVTPLTIALPQKALGNEIALSGDLWALQGEMEKYRGNDQFRAKKAILLRPFGRNMIATISGKRFPGIGQQKAIALWDRFGEGLCNILNEGDEDALSEIVTLEAARILIDGWQKLNPGEVIAWLDANRFPIGLGAALFEFYGEHVMDKLTRDPYRLLAFGQKWEKVDRIAIDRLGMYPTDPKRGHAAVAEALYRAYDTDGHTALDHMTLKGIVTKLLDNDASLADQAINTPTPGGWLCDEKSGLYSSTGAWLMERYIAKRLASMVDGTEVPSQKDMLYSHPTEISPSERNKANKAIMDWEKANHPLGDEQREAVWMALTNQVCVISGGAGVGKTATLSALYAGLDALGSKVVQMALAGRAAKRMVDMTGKKAMTIAGFIHASNKSSPDKNKEEQDEPASRTYVVDEASMLDIASAFQVFRKISAGCRLVLVGDDLQLPPVGAGLTFHLLCGEGHIVPRKHLSRVYRQDGATGIPTVSQSIRDGIWPSLPKYNGPSLGVSIYPCSKTEISDVVAKLYDELVIEEGNEDEVQILASSKGERDLRPGTVVHINQDLYNRRLKDQLAVKSGDELTGFCEGCPIMFTQNDWDRDLYNGSFGTITKAYQEKQILLEKDGITKLMPISDLLASGQNIPDDAEIILAEAEIDGITHLLSENDLQDRVLRSYAVTIHKSQGSQWNRIIVPISKSKLLDRCLVYTAITRGVKQVVLVGDIAATQKAVTEPARALSRITGLSKLL